MKHFLLSLFCLSSPLFASWSEPVVLSLTGDNFDPQVKIQKEGRAVALWKWASAAHEQGVCVSTFAGEWSAPLSLSCDCSFADAPQLAAHPMSEEAVVVWEQKKEKETKAGKKSIYASRYCGAQCWSIPQLLCERGFSPVVAMNQKGETTACWCRTQEGVTSIEVSQYQKDSGWSEPHVLGIGENPKIAFDEEGVAFVAWQGDETLWLAARDQGKWGEPQSIENVERCDLDICCAKEGIALIHCTSKGIGVKMQREGVWQERVSLFDDGAICPKIVAGDDGITVSWLGWDPLYSVYSLLVAHEKGGNWEGPYLLSDMGDDVVKGVLRKTSDNDIVTIWNTTTSEKVVSATYSQGGWSSPETLAGKAEAIQFDGTLAIWSAYDGVNYVIQASCR